MRLYLSFGREVVASSRSLVRDSIRANEPRMDRKLDVFELAADWCRCIAGDNDGTTCRKSWIRFVSYS